MIRFPRPRNNIKEALERFFESATPDEINGRLREDVYGTNVEVTVA